MNIDINMDLELNPNTTYKTITMKASDGRWNMTEYDKMNRFTKYCDSDGDYERVEYDAKGKKIFSSNPNSECRYEYDEHNRLVSLRGSNGDEYFITRYNNDRVVHKSSNEHDIWENYDEKDRLVSLIEDGVITTYVYGDNDELLHVYSSNGCHHSYVNVGDETIHTIYNNNKVVEICRYENINEKMVWFKELSDSSDVIKEGWLDHDKDGLIIHAKDSTGYESWYDRDERGNIISYKDSYGFNYNMEYDNNGNMIHYDDTDGITRQYKYNDNNDIIYYKDNTGYEVNISYEYWNLSNTEDDNNVDVDNGQSDIIENNDVMEGELVSEENTHYNDQGHCMYQSQCSGPNSIELGIDFELNHDIHYKTITMKDSFGNWNKTEYDKFFRMIKYTDSNNNSTNHVFDDAGNLIHITRNSYELQCDFDENNVFVYSHDSDGNEMNVTRYNNGRTVHKDSISGDEWQIYDEKNRLISSVMDDVITTFIYGDNNKLLHEYSSAGYHISYEVVDDETIESTYQNGILKNIIRTENVNGNIVWIKEFTEDSEVFSECWNEYNNSGLLIHSKTVFGSGKIIEEWYDRDECGNVISFHNTDGFAYLIEYNNDGKIIHVKDNNDCERFYEYNDKSELIHCKFENGYEINITYEYWSDMEGELNE